MDDAQAGTGPGEVISDIVARILRAKDRPAAGRLDNLREAGLTSLELVNVMLAVEDAFDLTLPQEAMTPENFRSIAAIEALVVSLI